MTVRPRPTSAILVLVGLLVSSCAESVALRCTDVRVGQSIGVGRIDRLDLLFLVDNSNSMTEEQASLLSELPRMIRVLATGDRDGSGGVPDFTPIRDLHLGVVTPDMGTGGVSVPTCARSDFGDDAVLRSQGRTDIAGCMAVYPTFLSFEPESDAEIDGFATDATCMLAVGTGGCGFEQPLEAMLKAASPAAPTDWTSADYVPPTFFRDTAGHGDGVNDGFFRPGALLALVPLSDEDDCSARDPDLFNPDSVVYGETDLNLRCFAHREEALHPIDRYADGLVQLRERAGLLVYAPIVGVPVDLVQPRPDYDRLIGPEGVRDERMLERTDPTLENRLVPSCNVVGSGVAFPPVRFVEVAQALDERGATVTVQSICQPSFEGVIDTIVAHITRRFSPDCTNTSRLVRRADELVECEVTVQMPEWGECAD